MSWAPIHPCLPPLPPFAPGGGEGESQAEIPKVNSAPWSAAKWISHENHIGDYICHRNELSSSGFQEGGGGGQGCRPCMRDVDPLLEECRPYLEECRSYLKECRSYLGDVDLSWGMQTSLEGCRPYLRDLDPLLDECRPYLKECRPNLRDVDLTWGM